MYTLMIGIEYISIALLIFEIIYVMKIAYLGKPYITLCIFFFVVEFCKVNLSDLLKGALVAFHLLITTLVFTCDLHSFFYTSIQYIYSDSYCHLVLGHGLFYYLFIGITLLYFIDVSLPCHDHHLSDRLFALFIRLHKRL